MAAVRSLNFPPPATGAAPARRPIVLHNGAMMSLNDLQDVAPTEFAPAIERVSQPSRTTPRHTVRMVERLESRTLLANVPDGFNDEQIVGGLNSPTAMEIAPDGRVFVAGQRG